MRTISTYFAIWLLTILSSIANAQTGEMVSMNTLTGKEHLPYCMVPELCVWERIAGLGETTSENSIALSATYNTNERQITVNGTKNGGDVEVWDVNGNTVAEKRSSANTTIIKTKFLPKGIYYVNYSNGNRSAGTKLAIN